MIRAAFQSGVLVGLALGGFAGGLFFVPLVALLFAWLIWRHAKAEGARI